MVEIDMRAKVVDLVGTAGTSMILYIDFTEIPALKAGTVTAQVRRSAKSNVIDADWVVDDSSPDPITTIELTREQTRELSELSTLPNAAVSMNCKAGQYSGVWDVEVDDGVRTWPLGRGKLFIDNDLSRPPVVTS